MLRIREMILDKYSIKNGRSGNNNAYINILLCFLGRSFIPFKSTDWINYFIHLFVFFVTIFYGTSVIMCIIYWVFFVSRNWVTVLSVGWGCAVDNFGSCTNYSFYEVELASENVEIETI